MVFKTNQCLQMVNKTTTTIMHLENKKDHKKLYNE